MNLSHDITKEITILNNAGEKFDRSRLCLQLFYGQQKKLKDNFVYTFLPSTLILGPNHQKNVCCTFLNTELFPRNTSQT